MNKFTTNENNDARGRIFCSKKKIWILEILVPTESLQQQQQQHIWLFVCFLLFFLCICFIWISTEMFGGQTQIILAICEWIFWFFSGGGEMPNNKNEMKFCLVDVCVSNVTPIISNRKNKNINQTRKTRKKIVLGPETNENVGSWRTNQTHYTFLVSGYFHYFYGWIRSFGSFIQFFFGPNLVHFFCCCLVVWPSKFILLLLSNVCY